MAADPDSVEWNFDIFRQNLVIFFTRLAAFKQDLAVFSHV